MKVGNHHIISGLSTKRIGSRQSLIVDAAHGIDVHARIQRDPLELLRCHEEYRTEDRLDFLQFFERLGLVQRGQAEVHDFHLEFPGG